MKKNKKIIIMITITIIILILCIIAYIKLFDNEENHKKNDNQLIKEENIKYTYNKEGPSFHCSNEPTFKQTYNYDKGDNVYCAITYELSGNASGIEEIWFETYKDEDIEYIETKLGYRWSSQTDNNIIHLLTEKPSPVAGEAYIIKFKINPSIEKENLKISFKNIKYKNEKDEYYKTDDSIIELKINETTNYKYKSSKNNDSILFYKFKENEGYQKINEYKCKSTTCYIYGVQSTSFIDLENGVTFLLDNNSAIMYDFNKGIIGEYKTLFYILYDEEYKQPYFYVSDLKNNKYGIIDTKGKIVKKFNLEKLDKTNPFELSSNTYSIKYDLLVDKKDNKYGIIKLKTDEIIIEHKYDDIRIYNDKYYKAKIDDTWYLYQYSTKEKVHEQGYKEIFFVTDEIIISQIDNYLYIKDYNGNNLIEDKIETYMDYNEQACCATPGGISVNYDKENEIIKIGLTKELDEDFNYDFYEYEYNINNKKLTKIK